MVQGGFEAEVWEQRAQWPENQGDGGKVSEGAGEVGRLAASCKQVCQWSVAVNILRKMGGSSLPVREWSHTPEEEEGEEEALGHQHELVRF